MNASSEPVPLGAFAIVGADRHAVAVRRASRSGDTVRKDKRPAIAAYLRGGVMIAPFMEYTEDVVGSRFGVSGGSAIVSDGSYFWRLDTADYVEHHGVALPSDFLAHGEASGWVPPVLSPDQVRDLERWIANWYRAGRDRDIES